VAHTLGCPWVTRKNRVARVGNKFFFSLRTEACWGEFYSLALWKEEKRNPLKKLKKESKF
jgi:hypothetical protein